MKSVVNKTLAGALLLSIASQAWAAHQYWPAGVALAVSPKKVELDNLKAVEVFNELVIKSEAFSKRVPFPTTVNKIAVIAADDPIRQARIVKQAQTTYVLYHEKTLTLIDSFLAYKKEYGSTIEKALYADIERAAFIDRLLIKRPLMFMQTNDQYLLRDGKSDGAGGFEFIGTPHEKFPLILKDYLSYDEMQMAALIGVSVPTYFINNGNRNNCGKKGAPGTYEPHGIYAGLVGARFEKPGFMEWQHMIITSEQNTAKDGYGLCNTEKSLLALWSRMYGLSFPTFFEAQGDKSGRYIPFQYGKGTAYFDSAVYKERMRLVIEPFLLDAHKRGLEQHKKIYVHAVGLGLGVWQIIPEQAKLMLEVYAQVIKDNNLSQIADLDFSWFPPQVTACGAAKNGEIFRTNKNAITIHFSKRNPADTLRGSDAGKLLMACYAWDGNSYPGNEYWQGMLTASGDPAAACCSTIAELQNPEINPFIQI